MDAVGSKAREAGNFATKFEVQWKGSMMKVIFEKAFILLGNVVERDYFAVFIKRRASLRARSSCGFIHKLRVRRLPFASRLVRRHPA